MTPAGFPHSDIPGSKPVCDSPGLIAAYHVLHRLLVPRHPPCALSSLTGILRCFICGLPSVSYSVVKERAQRLIRRARTCERARRSHVREISRSMVGRAGARRDPLSNLVEIAGLEPAASGLQSRRSPS